MLSPLEISVCNPPSGDRAQSTVGLPCLWVESRETFSHVREYFHLLTPGESAPADARHILALPDERSIRRILRRLPKNAEIRIFSSKLGLLTMEGLLLAPIAEDWLRLMKGESLEFPEAQGIARDALQSLHVGEISQSQWNIEKEELRQRCGLSGFDWNKYISDLEAEIHAAVDAKEATDPTERKRLELKALAQERDSCKFTDKLIEFCRRTGWTRNDVEREIRSFKSGTKAPKAKRLKGKDFLALETESISWVFPGIIPSRGVFVIGGHAGAGKTTFAYDAVGSLLLGEEFLGEKPVKTGKVLVVTGDELPCFSQDKLINRGIPLDNEDWEIILNWDVSQWSELEEAIADIRPALVVIDSFSSIHRDPSFDENSSQAKSTIYDLEALTNAYGCGCILIHHLSKSKENQGVAKLRGSSAISAAASVVCLMEELPGGGRKLSFPKVRGAQTEPFLTQLDGSTGRYEVIGGGDNPATKSLGDRVLAFLQKSPYNRYEQEEISQALGIPLSNKDSIYQALARLFKRGLITKRPSKNGGKRKVYGVANPSQLAHTEGLRSATVTQTDKEQDTHTPLPLKVSVKNAEIVTSKDVELTDTLTDNLTDTKLTPRNGVSLDNSSNAQLESDSAKLTNTDSQGCVCPESATVTQETVTGAVKAVGSHASVSEEMETAPWKAGDKFRYTGTRSAEMTKKYAGKILVVKSYTSARGGSIEAEGAKDGFPVWTVERVVN